MNFENKSKDSTENVTKKQKNWRKCRHLAVADKLNYVKRLENKESTTKIAQELGISPSTVRRWKIDKVKLENFSKNQGSGRKRVRYAADPLLDEAVHIWYRQSREQGIPISGSLIKGKAILLNEKLNGGKRFVASEGWLSRWKHRHNIKILTGSNEKLSAIASATETFKDEISAIIKQENLTLGQVFNCAETGLNYKMLPKKTFPARVERETPGCQTNKERITIMACTNADATLKLPLVVIGKSAKPRAFKNVPSTVLPIVYKHQKNTRMDSSIFEEWFKNEFAPRVLQFLKEKNLPSKAILIVNNAACYPKDLAVNGIRSVFLPPNATSVLQPLNQGILENLKRLYRYQLLQSILNAQEKGDDLIDHLKSINMKNIFFWVNAAWNSISSTTIRKCWKPLISQTLLLKLEDYEILFERYAQSSKLLAVLLRIEGSDDLTVDDVDEWIRETDKETLGVLMDDEIIEMVKPANSEDSNDIEDITETREEMITPEKASHMVDCLITFFEYHDSMSADEIAILWKAKQRITDINLNL